MTQLPSLHRVAINVTKVSWAATMTVMNRYTGNRSRSHVPKVYCTVSRICDAVTYNQPCFGADDGGASRQIIGAGSIGFVTG